jgi:squalene synthase HpnC
MSTAAELRSGKGHRDENFPVASHLIHPRHRATILAFYEFVRTADDIADHASLSADEKLARLDRLEQSLLGETDQDGEGVALRKALAARSLSPRHAQDLLRAFRLDATKLRYRDWDDLIDYCRYSAMPVGRFVLDVHGESHDTWPASDAICAALQIINHLQDCGADYRNLDRVYIPQDALAAAGTMTEALGAAKATPELKACLNGLARRTASLLEEGHGLPDQINDLRLSLEISVIHDLARHLTALLAVRDPLSEPVHLKSFGFAAVGALAVVKGLARRPFRRSRAAASGHREHQGRLNG